MVRSTPSPWLSAGVVVCALVLGCGGPETGPTETTEVAPETAAPVATVEEASGPDPLDSPVFESAEFNFRYVFPSGSWQRSTEVPELPEAALGIVDTERGIHFAVIPVRLEGATENLRLVRQAASDLLRKRTSLVDVKATSVEDLRGFSSQLTVAEGLVGNALVRMADYLLLSADGFYHLLTWAPLLAFDDDEISAEAQRLARRFEFLDPGAALVVEAQTWTEKAKGEVRLLDFDIVDAEFSQSLGKIIAVSANPPAVQMISLDGPTSETIPLGRVPMLIALTPDGSKAVVAHSARLTLVDLMERRVVVSRKVKAEPASLVFTSRGWVYLIRSGTQHDRLVGARLPGSTEVENKGHSIYGGSMLALHPDESSVYVANRGVSPDSLQKLDVSEGTPINRYRWQYHGDYSACGNLWISRAGRHIFTACGNVFNASKSRDRDMTYDGRLEDIEFIHALTEVPERRRLLVVPGERKRRRQPVGSGEVRLYDSRNLTLERVDTMPGAVVDGDDRQSVVHFVFAGPDTSRYYAVVRLPVAKVGREEWGIVARPL